MKRRDQLVFYKNLTFLVLEKKKANEAKPERTCVGNTEQVQSCEPPEPTSPLWATHTPTYTPLSSFASAPLTLSNLSYAHLIFHHPTPTSSMTLTPPTTLLSSSSSATCYAPTAPAPTSSSSPALSKHSRTHALFTPCMPTSLNTPFSTSLLCKLQG